MSDDMYGLRAVVGEKLSAVVFVLNYYQFQFDGPMFNVMTPVTVVLAAERSESGQDRFCNLICGQIGKVVSDILYQAGESISIIFDDASTVMFSLKPDDYQGPEAIIFYGRNDVLSVF